MKIYDFKKTVSTQNCIKHVFQEHGFLTKSAAESGKSKHLKCHVRFIFADNGYEILACDNGYNILSRDNGYTILIP